MDPRPRNIFIAILLALALASVPPGMVWTFLK